MGANRAIHVVTDQPIEPLAAARVLHKLAEKEQPGLFVLGKQAIDDDANRSEEHTSELQSLMRISYAVFCLKKKNNNTQVTLMNIRTTQHNRYDNNTRSKHVTQQY